MSGVYQSQIGSALPYVWVMRELKIREGYVERERECEREARHVRKI